MNASWLTIVSAHAFATGLLLGAMVLACLGWRARNWRRPAFLLAAGLTLFALGEWLVPKPAAAWVSGLAGSALAGAVILLALSGLWSPRLAWALFAVWLVGTGGLLGASLSRAGLDAWHGLRSMEVLRPWWLLGLLLVPAVAWASRRAFVDFSPLRRVTAITLRGVVIALIVTALAEPRFRQLNETVTVLFVLDRSLSVPPEIDPQATPGSAEAVRDLRWERIKRYIDRATGQRRQPLDQAGVIAFGRRPRLILPPSPVKLIVKDDMTGGLDFQYTDIAAALKLALASFPEGTAKRIVLFSDGNENLGNAEEQARALALNGVQVDVVPLAAGYRNDGEVLVQAVEAPSQAEQGTRVPIRVLLRNSSASRAVDGILRLNRLSEAGTEAVPIRPGSGVLASNEKTKAASVRLRPGLNVFTFTDEELPKVAGSFTYEARFDPIRTVHEETGEIVNGLPQDRPQNNRATTHVVARGRKVVLFLESVAKPTQHDLLVKQLSRVEKGRFEVIRKTTADLPQLKEELGVYLSNFDSVIIANVPAEEFSEEQQEMIRSNTGDQGCGLVMIGGPESFGAGGYQNTAIEKALPVDCDIKSMKLTGKGGLVMIMHASEMANGNAIQKEIAKLAIDKLAPIDMVGVLYYEFGQALKWHIKFQQVGTKRQRLKSQVDRMQPGDMPDFQPFVQAAFDELNRAEHELATKHVIIISDGEPSPPQQNLLIRMKAAKVTCTTVGVATHGAQEDKRMHDIAKITGGRFYGPNTNPSTKNPKALPAIYLKETRLVSRAFIHEGRFVPKLLNPSGPAEKLPADLPPLYGFVRTSMKPSNLAVEAIRAEEKLDQQYPLLAYWQYGLGKAVAFTSDARTKLGDEAVKGWDRDWVESDLYLKFWEQLVSWSLRGTESGGLVMITEFRDGKVRVTVEARDKTTRKPITNLRLDGAVTPPGVGGKPIELSFVQKNSGEYVAEFQAEEAGSYFLNARGKWRVKQMRDGVAVDEEREDAVRAGVTLPYSPEFADLETNVALLKRLAAATGGEVIAERDLDQLPVQLAAFRPGLPGTRSLQPIWHWLLMLAAVGLLSDVAIRRIAIEPATLAAFAARQWERLRGRSVASPTTAEFLQRLQSRKAEVGESLDKGARRFEASATATPPPPGPDDELPPPKPVSPPKPPPTSPTASPAEEPGDYFSKLKRAKKQALDDRQRGED